MFGLKLQALFFAGRVRTEVSLHTCVYLYIYVHLHAYIFIYVHAYTYMYQKKLLLIYIYVCICKGYPKGLGAYTPNHREAQNRTAFFWKPPCAHVWFRV